MPKTLRASRSDIKAALTSPHRFMRLMRRAHSAYSELCLRGEHPSFGKVLRGMCCIYHEAHPYDRSIPVLMSMGSMYLHARRRLRESWLKPRVGEQGSLF